jgi:hypothetical protein
MTVHHVNMNPIGAGFFHGGNFRAKPSAVSG